jgi:hypothetical protein
MPCKKQFAGACTLEIVVVEIALGRYKELHAWVCPCSSLILGYCCLYVILCYKELYIQMLAVMEQLEAGIRGIRELSRPVAAVDGM